MPANLIGATPNGVMPASLCTAFTELREYVQLQNQYHDGTIQRSQLAQTSRRTFRLSKRLSSSLLSALYSFWGSQNGGLTPFVFYNSFDVASGQQIGSNYDPTGSNTQGRVTVVFRGHFAAELLCVIEFGGVLTRAEDVSTESSLSCRPCGVVDEPMPLRTDGVIFTCWFEAAVGVCGIEPDELPVLIFEAEEALGAGRRL